VIRKSEENSTLGVTNMTGSFEQEVFKRFPMTKMEVAMTIENRKLEHGKQELHFVHTCVFLFHPVRAAKTT